MATALLGTPIRRVDGTLKVTGAAQYAAEFPFANMAHAVIAGSTIASGTVRKVNTDAIAKLAGLRLVMTHENRGPLGKLPNSFMEGAMLAETRPPLEDSRIYYAGQYVACVVADTLEQAQHAAASLPVEYDEQPFAISVDAQHTHGLTDFTGQSLSFERGNFESAFASSPAHFDATYTTPNEHPCALEPHATIADFKDGALTLYSSTQWVFCDQNVVADALKMPREKVRVICPHTGGMFGSKGSNGSHAILAALASRQLGRPVKVVLTRPQVLITVGHRSETVQRLRIGAKQDGTLLALRHDVRSHDSMRDDFAESASETSRMLYNIPAYQTTHEAVRINVMRPSSMRAPGAAPGQFALESALDELAYQLNVDPIDLRRINYAAVNPHLNKPFSNSHLLDCYARGAERFGWAARNQQPRSMRQGKTLIGYGMSTSTHHGLQLGSVVQVRLEKSPDGVRAIASTGGSDVGTGLYTMLTATVADGLGLPLDKVTVKLGDSTLPPCAVAGGSTLTASTAPAATDACGEVKRELLKIASETADGFTGAHELADEFLFQQGRLAHRSDPARAISYSDLLALSRRDAIEGKGSTGLILGHNDKFSFQSFGANFVEVRVREEIGQVRVSRIVSVFDCGRILSAKTTRSQLMGGIVFGIGMALMEELVYDRNRAHAANADFAGYLVPVNADVPDMDISWIGEPDTNFNSLGCRGVGEIGITGVAAAIANAVFHATGKRIRNLPITPDKLLGS